MRFTRNTRLCVLMSMMAMLLLVAGIAFVRTPRGVRAASGPLRDLADARGISIGAAVNTYLLPNGGTYTDVLGREFNMVVAENTMKFNATEPQQGVFDFSEGDKLVTFAQQHNQVVRGHNLVWHQALPDWLANGNFSRDQLIAILHNHISNVVGHFKGVVKVWDVVNEPFIDPCCETTADPNGLRDSNFWYKGIGPDYIDMAFQWAHEADPDAKLYLNEYGGEDLSTKSNNLYNYVKGMLGRGVPINGIGLQMHLLISNATPPSAQDVQANMQRLGDLGLEVQVTEMDVDLHNLSGSTDQKLQQQAQIYGDITRACLAVSACKALVTWGVDDGHSWIVGYVGHTDGAPLLFDANYQPKPAYYAVADALSGTSTTTTTLNPSADRFNVASYTGTEDYIYASKWQTAYLKFDISSVSGSVNHATLRLYYDHWYDQGNLVVRAYQVNDDSWSETDNASLPAVGDQITTTTISATGWMEFDVSNFVASKKGGDNLVSIAITADSDLWTPIRSRENSSNPPELVVTSS